MTLAHDHPLALTRRHFLGQSALGLGGIALASIDGRGATADREGEARHLSVSSGRTVADGDI